MEDIRLVPLAALQHYAYCPRQCALIHNEQMWADNWFTAQGEILHQRVDQGGPEVRKGVRFERGVLVHAPCLGLTGKLDLLEIEPLKERYTPVEYKRGKPKVDNWDRVQVCAQALCLEEMLGVVIQDAALWYWQTRHRESVIFDESLRCETLDIISQVKRLLNGHEVTKVIATNKRCKSCSLINICQPDLIRNDHSKDYSEQLFKQ